MALPSFFSFFLIFSFALTNSGRPVRSQVTIPARFDGFVYENRPITTDSIIIEAFFDPVCPDSRAAWPPLKQALDLYGQRVYLVVHPFPLPTAATATTVIYPTGEIKQFYQPTNAAEIMMEAPNFFLVNADSLRTGRRFAALNADDDLELSAAYVMFPMKRLNSVVTAADLGALCLSTAANSRRSGAAAGGNVRVLPEPPAPSPKLNLDDIEEFWTMEVKTRLSMCSYHDNGFASSRALHVINELNASATYDLLELFFEYQEEFYNQPTFNLSRATVVSLIVSFSTTAVGSSYYSAVASGFTDPNTDLMTRVSFKYGCSRGVIGTPSFFVNGFALPDAGSAIDYNKWRSIIDPLIQEKGKERKESS